MSVNIALRPYQAQGLEDIRREYRSGAQRVVYVAPTGSGKTVLFSAVVQSAMQKGSRCLILAHRVELVEQTSNALASLDIKHGVVAPGYTATADAVQVASVGSMVRRLGRYDEFDLLVIDEAHHSNAKTWRVIIDSMPRTRVLGVTATPERADGAGLGDVFDTMVLGPTTAELIKAGYLSKYWAYAPSEPPDLSGVSMRAGDFAKEALSDMMTKSVIIGSAVEAYTDYCMGKRAIVFGVDCRHSEMLAERFRDRGFRASHVDASTPKQERKAMIKALSTGELQILTNCNLFSEGLDVPAVEAVLMVRPTQSLGMFLQQCGRALRVAPGKERALILDLAGNLYRHGLPDADRQWSLDGKSRRQRERSDKPRLRECESCGAINPPKALTCMACGESLKPTPAEIVEQEIELQRIEDAKQFERLRAMTYRELLDWAGADRKRLQQAQIARDYKPGFPYRRLQEMGVVA
jgi:superfamily II DNA or RNA helicase